MKHTISIEFQRTQNPSAFMGLLTSSFLRYPFFDVITNLKTDSVYLQVDVAAEDYKTALCLVTATLQKEELDHWLIQFSPCDEVTRADIAGRLDLSPTTIKDRVRDPSFPAPIFLGQNTFWSWAEVVQYSFDLPPSKTHSLRRETKQWEVDQAIAIKEANQLIREKRT